MDSLDVSISQSEKTRQKLEKRAAALRDNLLRRKEKKKQEKAKTKKQNKDE